MSHYYVTYNSMMMYNQHLRATMSTLVLEHVLIPMKETVEDPAATLTILQAYISQLNLNGMLNHSFNLLHVLISLLSDLFIVVFHFSQFSSL
ncbi:hypothetical protein EV421DRAFT_1769637 [Armillaria borealis]|uniref:Uncharacterized protein n=1 Tax=Armillaria borealis TaxID=47425 RepID=A0AA39K1G0_9AGAR|nr:hypothetical protein EV421DRAFT_1859349 [Armillaria borealis]KAK0452562.1 hypothetical protein EV421DRAFT_1769637 [Armillaria borealis]